MHQPCVLAGRPCFRAAVRGGCVVALLCAAVRPPCTAAVRRRPMCAGWLCARAAQGGLVRGSSRSVSSTLCGGRAPSAWQSWARVGGWQLCVLQTAGTSVGRSVGRQLRAQQARHVGRSDGSFVRSRLGTSVGRFPSVPLFPPAHGMSAAGWLALKHISVQFGYISCSAVPPCSTAPVDPRLLIAWPRVVVRRGWACGHGRRAR